MAYYCWVYSGVHMEKILKGIVYRIMKKTAAVGLYFYYRGTERNGTENIPKSGPFIFAVNHQNAFMDAIVVGAVEPIPTYYMTRSDVFKPPFDWFLDAFKMMPIYRIRDGYSALHRNEEIFRNCKNILERKEAILIFPEGNHGLDYFLRPLTKGLARIALQSQNEMDLDIKIIPVGLNYFDHFHSGNKLIVNYGKAINAKDFIDDYREHPQKGLRHITKSIAEGMKETLIIPEKSDNYEQDKLVFNRANENEDYYSLKETGRLAYKKNQGNPLLGRVGRLFGLFNLPPLAFLKWVFNNKAKQPIFKSSIKLAFLIIVFPVWFLLCFLVGWVIGGWPLAMIVFLTQTVSLIIRQELTRLAR